MPRVRDLLLRFRPSGSPGAAGPAGVPADRTGQLAAELEPVLAALAATEQECTAIVEEGRRTAARTRTVMAARAEELRASAPARAEAERAAAAAQAAQTPSASPPSGADPLLVALAEHARAVAPRHLAQVAAAVEALCAPPDGGASRHGIPSAHGGSPPVGSTPPDRRTWPGRGAP